MTDSNVVYIVHAIDTEGPLYEPLSATFERLRDTFGIGLDPTHANLEKLKSKQVPLDGREDVVADFLNPFRMKYHETWASLEAMLANIMGDKFRRELPDSFGGGWVYNWHCVDHVGYTSNPRHKDLGFHNISDRYEEFLDKYNSRDRDAIEWHFHPMSTYREAHRCATSYENSPHLHEGLCRKIIERHFFPVVFRAGFHTERPDSHWFLEQWIPYDCSNIATDNAEQREAQNDLRNGRFGDWRRAPADWSIYNPDFYDYQKPGSCRRYIARFLNIDSRVARITQEEVDKAFRRAAGGEPTLMGVLSHDYRDIAVEVNRVRELIADAAKTHPQVKFQYSTAREAFKQVVHKGRHEKLQLDVKLDKTGSNFHLEVRTKESRVFGPQPYLAIKTRSGRFIHDNFDFGLDGQSWHYVFDADSVLSSDLDVVAVAANNRFGDTFLETIPVAP
ncbi:hypothetical protein ACTRW9_10625 [Nitrospina sp. 32_T5]|uniref:hypothetical protein n=1 Tax=unclassified Nitrospina TaxID=2638683 RepID=UPI003F976CE7